MNIQRIQKKLQRRFGAKVRAQECDRIIRLTGELDNWDEVVEAGYMAVVKKDGYHVVNDIRYTGEIPPVRLPRISDSALEGASPDVLVIGGGVSGVFIARELTRYKLDVLLVEKEPDVALGASGRNDGEVHPGVDLSKGTLKQKYVILGNEMYEKTCEELSVPFARNGQYAGFVQGILRPMVWAFALQRRLVCGVKGACVVGRKALRAAEPRLNREFAFALYTPTAGVVCPYGLTIACAENAIANGATLSLNTAVLDMTVENGEITSVRTNRGTIHPRLVINAAGTFADEIARMAHDRFYSIHPRKGTNSILDKNSSGIINSISSIKKISLHRSHTKGGGVLRMVHGNALVGPDAQETMCREDFSTAQSSLDVVYAKQVETAPELSQRDIITYFAGVRAPTYEEDFVLERGRATKNLVHCAGIQSPGLTTAPAVAVDIAKIAVDALREKGEVLDNPNFNPVRKGIPVLRDMSDEQREKLIKENPDYGVIVCRCEQISKGEIIDALNSPLCVPTLDGIKKRLRPGMGRCQGGFCSPLVAKIIAEHEGVPVSRVLKGRDGSFITFGRTKGRDDE